MSTTQLEEDHSETQRLLAQERSARALQENLLNSHLRKQQEIRNENKKNISRSTEVNSLWFRCYSLILCFFISDWKLTKMFCSFKVLGIVK